MSTVLGKMTMAVNMVYVPKPESGTKVLKLTETAVRHSSNFRKAKATAFLKCLSVYRRVAFRGGYWKENLCKYNILQENDITPGKLLIMHKITHIHHREPKR